ncbi:dihydrolipoamide acetyltransferase family protein [Reichenbachiella sp. MALMAid0571]|uniref:dihydrolipoamide acetyltransferase family protein n=1 Tax=Reichenbachiella sp. MALMAid0571 TaxID=3143939 RepID=UPI0032E001A7
MALVEMVMPKMGESIMEGTVLSWLKKVGDPIEEDESVLEVATDKVDTEVPSIHAGILKEILAKKGEVVSVGNPIAIIETDQEEVVNEQLIDTDPEENAEAILEEVANISDSISIEVPHQTERLSTSDSTRFYSPLVLNIAREENIPKAELEIISGTGSEGRVTKKDILAYVASRKSANSDISTPTNGATTQPAIFSGEDEIIEMDRMRKVIADRMMESKRIAAHVTSFVEADMSKVVAWRNKNKRIFQEREGQPLTFTPIFIEAVVRAIKDYPMMNISIDGYKIIKKKAINIGMAVALPSGNLIVPVIHNADQLSIGAISLKVNELAKRARNNQLTPKDLEGGTYTISNVGSFGNVMGTPILVQPQVGILALGTIQKKPSVIETPQGDFIGVRHKMFLSHSYDHRVVDGALGGMFVRRVADYLEKFDETRVI